MLCIFQIGLTPPQAFTHPDENDPLQAFYEINHAPQPEELNDFIATLLFEVELHLNRIRNGTGTLPWTRTTLLQFDHFCRHTGRARLLGEGYAYFHLLWFLAKYTVHWQYYTGDWLAQPEHHRTTYARKSCWQDHTGSFEYYPGRSLCFRCEEAPMYAQNLCRSCFGYQVLNDHPRPVATQRSRRQAIPLYAWA